MKKWLTITMLGVALLGAAGAATAGGVDLSIGVGVPLSLLPISEPTRPD